MRSAWQGGGKKKKGYRMHLKMGPRLGPPGRGRLEKKGGGFRLKCSRKRAGKNARRRGKEVGIRILHTKPIQLWEGEGNLISSQLRGSRDRGRGREFLISGQVSIKKLKKGRAT